MHYSSNIAEVPAPAKINLCLIVGPRRGDGFHPVCSLMEKIMLFDTLRTIPEAEGTGIRLTGSDIPAAENIVMRAARALEREIGRRLDVDIELRKEIPAAAGLGGGSSDAAAILKLLNFHFELRVPPGKLAEIGLSLGADVPFFLSPGPQLAQGIGEALTPVPGMPDYALVLVKPSVSLSTAAVYESFDGQNAAPGVFEDRCAALRSKLAKLAGLETLTDLMENDLETAAAALFPDLQDVKKAIIETGAKAALMSGSGSSVFGIFPDIEAANAAARVLMRSYPLVWAAQPLRA